MSHGGAGPFIIGDGSIEAYILNAGFGIQTHPSRRGIIAALLGKSMGIRLPKRSRRRNVLLGPKRVLDISAHAVRPVLARTGHPKSMLL